MGFFSEKCSKCDKEVSMWNSFHINNNIYCNDCKHKRDKLSKKDLENEDIKLEHKRDEKIREDRIKEVTREVYCNSCGSTFKFISENPAPSIFSSIIGMISAIFGGFGWLSWSELKPCPHCGKKLSYYKDKKISKYYWIWIISLIMISILGIWFIFNVIN